MVHQIVLYAYLANPQLIKLTFLSYTAAVLVFSSLMYLADRWLSEKIKVSRKAAPREMAPALAVAP